MTFSIIVPCYNLKTWIRECLDSVLAQSFADWECVVVDDGSTDGGGAILDEYAAKDARFRVIHQANGGVSAARNAALELATGSWVLFLDGDDLMTEGALSRLDAIISDYPAEKIVRFGFETFDDGCGWNGLSEQYRGALDVGCLHDISKRLTDDEFFTYVWQHTYRRDLVADLRFKSYRRGEDRIFVDDLLLNRVDSFVEITDKLYGYRLRAGSAMNSVPKEPVIVDELCHRIELIQLVNQSGKEVEYGRRYWIRHFFAYDFFCWLKGRDSTECRRLIEEWLLCVSVLAKDPQVMLRQRIAYKLSVVFHSHIPTILLCYMWTWWYTYSVTLRAYRKLRWVVRQRGYLHERSSLVHDLRGSRGHLAED